MSNQNKPTDVSKNDTDNHYNVSKIEKEHQCKGDKHTDKPLLVFLMFWSFLSSVVIVYG